MLRGSMQVEGNDLGTFRVESRDPEDFAARLAEVAPDFTLRPQLAGPFHARAEAWRLPRVGMFRVSHNGGRVTTPELERLVNVSVIRKGQLHAGAGKVFGPGWAYVVGGRERLDFWIEPPHEGLVLTVPTDALEPGGGGWDGSLGLDLAAPGARLLSEALALLETALDRPPGPSSAGQSAISHIETALLELLTCVGAEALPTPRSGASRVDLRLLHRADEWLRANLEQPITSVDVARHIGISRRSLYRLYERHRGVGPMAFLKRLRLDAARQALLRCSREEERVIDIALRHGFLHMGRFAADYRRAFGERPSETLGQHRALARSVAHRSDPH